MMIVMFVGRLRDAPLHLDSALSIKYTAPEDLLEEVDDPDDHDHLKTILTPKSKPSRAPSHGATTSAGGAGLDRSSGSRRATAAAAKSPALRSQDQEGYIVEPSQDRAEPRSNQDSMSKPLLSSETA